MNRLRGGVPWVVVAAGCAAVVGLASWPRPTLGVLCIVIGATAVLAGVRQLLAEHRGGHTPAAVQTGTAAPGERCCVCGGPETPYENYRGQLFCWPCADCPCGQVPCVRSGINDPAVSATAAAEPDPDASGDVPETARTIPDATGQQPADQPGDHPDDPRNADASVPGAEYERVRLMLHASRDVQRQLRDELAALHHGEEPYTDEAIVPTPAQWIWRWNRASPAERLEYAARAIARTDRLAAVYAELIYADGRSDLTAADVNARIRAALDGTRLHVVHPGVEQPVSGGQSVDESAGGRGEVVHETPMTPPLTGRMIPTDTPTCGSNLPSTNGIPCGEPAAWHIRWRRGADDDPTFPASLACHTHMDQIARGHAWYDRHHAGPACSSANATWLNGRCAEAT